MAILRSNGILLVDSIPTHTPTSKQARLARLEDTLILYYYNGTNWVTVDLEAVSSIDPDGNDTPITRGNANTNIEPTSTEIPSPVSGDTASIFLNDGQLEKWSYNGSDWSLAYTLIANEAANLSTASDPSNVTIESSSGTNAVISSVNATEAGIMTAALFQDLLDLITLSGVGGNSQNLGSFTGTAIPDNSNIKEALQIIETALENGAFSVSDTNSIDITKTGDTISADLNISATQNGSDVSILADGLSVSINESDPIFSASPAATILNSDINNWNEAFGWGDHADEGYITDADGGNAATLDGLDSSQFLRSDTNDTATGDLRLEGIVTIANNGTTPLINFNDGTVSRFLFTTGNTIRFRFDGTNDGTIYHSGNDGSGSGLDADLLDGQQGSFYLNTGFGTQVKQGSLVTNGLLHSQGSDSERLRLEANINPFLSFVSSNGGAAIRRGFLQYSDLDLNIRMANEFGGIDFLTGVNGSESSRMLITESGDVGIGVQPIVRLHVADGALRTWTPITGSSFISESTESNRNFVTIVGRDLSELWFGDAALQNSGRVRYDHTINEMSLWTNATSRVQISSSGNVNVNGDVTAVDFNATSDRTLKENITPYKPKPVNLDYVEFDWKDSGKHQLGLIAQDVEKENPEFVNTDDEGIKSIKMVQLLLAKVAELEDRIKQLEQ